MTPVDRAREIIDNARRLVVFTGAGVSADSGVPTFRGSSGDSFWGKYDPMQLASPQGFSADPGLVYNWYNWRRGQLATVQPNPAHHAIAVLQERGGAIVITQNVDGLHERVAPASATVLRLHGTIAADKCQNPYCDYTEAIDVANLPPLRPCPRCAQRLEGKEVPPWLRPAVVWFGETLDPLIWDAAEHACESADAMLVVGTSGEVYPAANLVRVAARRGARVAIVNLEPGPWDQLVDVAIHGRAADVIPQLVTPRTSATS